jgi:hypothetical protein
VVFAILLGMLGRRYGMILGAINRSRRAPVVGGMVGILLGGMFGTLLGAMAVAAIGSVSGSIAGVLLADLLTRRQPKGRIKFLAGMAGACAGTIIFALSQDREEALGGLFVGTLTGILTAIFLVLAALLTLAFLAGRRGQ